ncbi:hypothetical protein SLE2022_084530 [Rubroshorea leprosula]
MPTRPSQRRRKAAALAIRISTSPPRSVRCSVFGTRQGEIPVQKSRPRHRRTYEGTRKPEVLGIISDAFSGRSRANIQHGDPRVKEPNQSFQPDGTIATQLPGKFRCALPAENHRGNSIERDKRRSSTGGRTGKGCKACSGRKEERE